VYAEAFEHGDTALLANGVEALLHTEALEPAREGRRGLGSEGTEELRAFLRDRALGRRAGRITAPETQWLELDVADDCSASVRFPVEKCHISSPRSSLDGVRSGGFRPREWSSSWLDAEARFRAKATSGMMAEVSRSEVENGCGQVPASHEVFGPSAGRVGRGGHSARHRHRQPAKDSERVARCEARRSGAVVRSTPRREFARRERSEVEVRRTTWRLQSRLLRRAVRRPAHHW
jgi:hypothetical protein